MKKKNILIIVAAVLAVIGVGIICSAGNRGAHFMDVSIELGTETVSLSDFCRENTRSGRAAFVSNVSNIDLSVVCEYPITLSYCGIKETVRLSICDTTAPSVIFVDELTVSADSIPAAEDFVLEARDMSPVTISFAQEPHIPRDYEDITVTVIVADEYGNETKHNCTVHFAWMRSDVTLELGNTITVNDILYNPDRDLLLINTEILETVNKGGVGVYTVESSIAGKNTCTTITVQDTTPPELQLSDLIVHAGKTISPENFVTSASDISGNVSLAFAAEPNTEAEGEKRVTIIATDAAGNTNEQSALLTVVNKNTPIFYGLTPLLTTRGRSPQYSSNVSAATYYNSSMWYDVDDSQVDISTPGTYYATYRSQSTPDNVATAKRKVIVLEDGENTSLYVESIAKSLSNDPEEICSYVRKTLGYTHEWGDDDPVSFGFTYHRGNCYVHAMCLKALFDYKGIENQLIWATNKSHYWLIVKIDGKWKHIDPTPSSVNFGWDRLMNDSERAANLGAGLWDKSLWPACE